MANDGAKVLNKGHRALHGAMAPKAHSGAVAHKDKVLLRASTSRPLTMRKAASQVSFKTSSVDVREQDHARHDAPAPGKTRARCTSA